MSVTLKELRKYGFIPRNTHRWTKQAREIRSQYEDKFGDRKIPDHLSRTKVSSEAARVLRSVNIDVIGNHALFPTDKQRHKITIRETKHGIFVRGTRVLDSKGNKIKGGDMYEIVLAKNGDHIKYAKSLRRDGYIFGTLKNNEYQIQGRTKQGYMRDTAVMYEDIDSAVEDERYKPANRTGFAHGAENVAIIRVKIDWSKP